MYAIEGWQGLRCVAARWVTYPATAVREAIHQVLDKDAETVWVRKDGIVIYTLNEALTWQRHAGDERLERAIAEQEGASR